MEIISEENYPKEITISLEKYKADENIDTKCFVAHNYVEFVGSKLIEDIKGEGYFIKSSLQIPIATMIKLLEKLNTCPHLQKEHLENKNYLYEENVVLFEEWHLSDKDKEKQRSEYLIRDKEEKEWLEIPKKLWSQKKLEILKKLK